MGQYERVCPVEYAGQLDIWFRRFVQSPARMLNGKVKEGMVVLELGCGSGYFTAEIARRVGKSGKVIAADLQEGMLDLVRDKVGGTDIESRVELHKCGAGRIGVTEKVDLVVAFFMVHEVADERKMLEELKSLLKPGGSVYIAEFRTHPPRKNFEEMVEMARDAGFVVRERSAFLISRAVVLAVG